MRQLLALVFVLWCGPFGAFAEPTVVLISFDGVRHDALDDPELKAFARVEQEGVRAESLVPVFPASTFANHVSLVTGAPPDVHGIVGNRFLDPERGLFDYDADASFIEAEPVWVSAERQGVRSAAFFLGGFRNPLAGTGSE